MQQLQIQFPFDISDEIDKLVRRDQINRQLIKDGKIHTAMNFILNNSYYEDIFEEFFLANAYTTIHGWDDYYLSLFYEFNLVNDYISKQLHLNVYDYWKQFYINVYRKVERIKQRIDKMLDQADNERYFVYFTTLKLNDDYYLNPETVNRENYTEIRTKIRKFIKEYSDFYVFNKDFGLKCTRRLHFHGCMLMSKGLKPSITKNFEKVKNYGFITLEAIDKNSQRLSQYLNKLSKHALKVNYGFNRENLIYSRGN